MKVLTERVGTFHSPALVANFVRMVGLPAPPPPASEGSV
jgi:hypothetical protein